MFQSDSVHRFYDFMTFVKHESNSVILQFVKFYSLLNFEFVAQNGSALLFYGRYTTCCFSPG